MITKLGKELCKEAGIARNVGQRFIRLLQKTKPEHIRKPFDWAYKGLRKPTGLAVRGLERTGKLVRDYPHSAIPAVGLGIYGGATMKDRVQKNYLHTDPQMTVTRRVATNDKVIPGLMAPRIDYRTPDLKQHFRNKNLIY